MLRRRSQELGSYDYHSTLSLGALSVFTRQTNIVWILFAAGTGVMNITIGSKRDDASLTEAYLQVPVTSQLVDVRDKQKSALRKRKTGGAMETDNFVRPTSNIPSAQRSSLQSERMSIL